MMERRKFITASSIAVAGAVGGCLGGGSDSDGDTSDGDNAESTENGSEDEPGTESGSGSDSDSESGVNEELFGAAADVEAGEDGELQLIEGDIDNVLTGIEIVDHVGILATFPDRVTLTVSARVRNTGSEVFNLFNYGGASLITFDSDGNQLSEDRSGVAKQTGDGTPPGETFVVDLYGGEEGVSRYEIEFNCENTSEGLAYCPEN